MGRGFEEVDHTADIAIRVWGEDLIQLFTRAARGMASQVAEIEGVDSRECEIEVSVQAEDRQMLLVEWLSELLYLGEREGVVFTQFDILELSSDKLRAIVRGGRAQEYQAHIKAVTFSELDIQRRGGVFETVIVFDV